MKIIVAVVLAAASFSNVYGVSFAADGSEETTSETVSSVASQLETVTRWQIVGPLQSSADFHGVVNFDNVGVAGTGMMYPASTAAGLIAGVLTHALVNDAMKNSAKAKRQDEADVVLDAYRPTLQGITNFELVKLAAKGTIAVNQLFEASSQRDTSVWTIEVEPRFLITQDQSSIALINSVRVYSPGDESQEAIYRNLVHVVSVARSETDLYDYWTKDDGAAIKHESAALLAESIAAVLRIAKMENESSTAGHKTIRYMEGRSQKIVRARVLNEACGRLLLRTLRGELMLVPGTNPASGFDESSCPSYPIKYSAELGS